MTSPDALHGLDLDRAVDAAVWRYGYIADWPCYRATGNPLADYDDVVDPARHLRMPVSVVVSSDARTHIYHRRGVWYSAVRPLVQYHRSLTEAYAAALPLVESGATLLLETVPTRLPTSVARTTATFTFDGRAWRSTDHEPAVALCRSIVKAALAMREEGVL